MRTVGLRVWIWAAVAAVGAVLVATPALGQGSAPSGSSGVAYSIQLQDPIDPATQKWVSSALDDAASQHAKLAIIRLDTPGGLLGLDAHDHPGHGRRADAGGRLRLAERRARGLGRRLHHGGGRRGRDGAGDATSARRRRSRSAPAARARTCRARSRTTPRPGCGRWRSAHGRNADLAGRLVTQAKNLTAHEALKDNLIDVIAPSQEALLKKLDGFQVQGPKRQVLHTGGPGDPKPRHAVPLPGARGAVQPERRLSPDPGRDPRADRRGVQPGPHRPRHDRSDLAAPGPLRLLPASGEPRGSAPARRRHPDDHRRGPPADPRHPRRLGGGGASSPPGSCSTPPTRARSRSRRWWSSSSA